MKKMGNCNFFQMKAENFFDNLTKKRQIGLSIKHFSAKFQIDWVIFEKVNNVTKKFENNFSK